MSIGAQDDREEVAGAEIKKVKALKYLGPVASDDGLAVAEINERIKIG